MSEGELVELTVGLCETCVDFMEVLSRESPSREEGEAALFLMADKARELTLAIDAHEVSSL